MDSNVSDTNRTSRLDMLCDIEGFDDVLDFVSAYFCAGTVPAICTNEGCGYTDMLEPDADGATCEDCDTPTVTSGLRIYGIV